VVQTVSRHRLGTLVRGGAGEHIWLTSTFMSSWVDQVIVKTARVSGATTDIPSKCSVTSG
jgi:hypothetical protein